MTATDNLWPEFSLDEVVRSPKTILNEQAEFLAKGTKNLLKGNTTTNISQDGSIFYYFEIVAPNLSGYKYILFYIYQKDVFPYPCTLNFNKKEFNILTEDILMQKLKDIFNDEYTKKVISALLAQSKDNSSSSPRPWKMS